MPPSRSSRATASERFLHVANGHSVTMTLEAAGVPGARSVWADPLYEGPVPGGIGDDDLIEVRERFLGQPAEPGANPDDGLHAWREVIARHDEYDELVLWYEHDLFDQLNLVQLLPWIRAHVPATTRVSLICIGSFPGRPNFKGLGELRPDELAPLLETRTPVNESQYALADRAWESFRASTPESLDALRRGDTAAMPFLAEGLTRFLQEYPWTRDGLSRTERRLMELASGDGIDLLKAFPRMSEGEHAYYVTDATLLTTARTLARTSPPLLIFEGGDETSGHILHGTVRTTDEGQLVLAGQLDRVAACGIDRWFGGVHLRSSGPIWRWDDTRRCMIRT